MFIAKFTELSHTNAANRITEHTSACFKGDSRQLAINHGVFHRPIFGLLATHTTLRKTPRCSGSEQCDMVGTALKRVNVLIKNDFWYENGDKWQLDRLLVVTLLPVEVGCTKVAQSNDKLFLERMSEAGGRGRIFWLQLCSMYVSTYLTCITGIAQWYSKTCICEYTRGTAVG